MSFFSYQLARDQNNKQNNELMEFRTTDAQNGALERLQSAENELILQAASPGVARALAGAGDVASGTA